MADPNRVCSVCTDGANSAEFTICAECHERLSNDSIGLKCLNCGEHKFLPRNQRTVWRIRRILDLWDFYTRPGICAYKANAIMAAVQEDAAKKAVIIYAPNCPKCYIGAGDEPGAPAHPLTMMRYKIACFSVGEFQMHSLREENIFSGQQKIIH